MPKEFFDAYVECALWSSLDNYDEQGGHPLDENYGPEDIAPETLASMQEDCEGFWTENARFIHTNPGRAGHDFWLTRNGHGAGFWDGDWGDKLGRFLTEKCRPYGEVDLYVGDDGRIYS